ncbi:heme NO-binding protein [Aquicoccus sp. SCR17]|nr:heme NO-binding protein [Carideicomes alvinocaridis]
MHGLINRAIQGFVRDTYGPPVWAQVMRQADLGFAEFEAMLDYDDAATYRVLAEVAQALDRPLPGILEDIGTYLVSDPRMERLRRLLRFGGDTFEEFLLTLDDLPEWARLAVPDLTLPELEIRALAPGTLRLSCVAERTGWGHVIVGMLRALADDYGALVFLEHVPAEEGREIIEIAVLESEFAAGRDFELGLRSG